MRLLGLGLGLVALPHLEDIHTCWELSLGQHFEGKVEISELWSFTLRCLNTYEMHEPALGR